MGDAISISVREEEPVIGITRLTLSKEIVRFAEFQEIGFTFWEGEVSPTWVRNNTGNLPRYKFTLLLIVSRFELIVLMSEKTLLNEFKIYRVKNYFES